MPSLIDNYQLFLFLFFFFVTAVAAKAAGELRSQLIDNNVVLYFSGANEREQVFMIVDRENSSLIKCMIEQKIEAKHQ